MPLVNADFKGMEILTAMWLSQDPIGMEEQISGFDLHGDNQTRLKLPSRLIAKIFIFRLLFGGTAYAYATDADFAEVKWSERKWQEAIEAFYDKYKGLDKWHRSLMEQVQSTGKISIPTGRTWYFSPIIKNGEARFPRTQILNYPVQGLGADLMSIARVSLWRRMRSLKLISRMIGTVHDSILTDGPQEEVDTIVQLCYNVWSDLPMNFEKLFGVPFNLPCRVEVQTGPNWKDMQVCESS